MLRSCLDGKVNNLVKIWKKQRAAGSEKSLNFMDGSLGKTNIANHLAYNYSTLYNSSDSSDETLKFVDDLHISKK